MVESPYDVSLTFKDELKLVLTPSRTAKQVYVYDVKAELCCQPFGKLSEVSY